ncbi:putative 28S ribosomal protein S5, mitochondrial [Camponotus floridanus]|uniref:putative 28S ribosomal protein S5, mitochondrial n=1 Tax=Camponotus floridanus TaxID=104421 RepID=UPI000DC68245|nr:putative 28S ribosomal protein S5, mitochondrial [Camponotus floridanus]
MGKIPIQFPGLNTPVFKGKELIQQQKLLVNLERKQKLMELQSQTRPMQIKLSPLECGWMSVTMDGRSIELDLIGKDTFESFETWILENKMITCITGNLARKTRISSFIVTGNGNGLAEFALSKAKASLKMVKNRAGQRLMYIPTYKEYTVLHDFFTQFENIKIFVKKIHEG